MTEVPFGEEWAGQWRAERAGESAGRPGSMEPEPEDPGRWADPEDRPWTPIPRQAHAMERGLIPAQRRLKKTSRSA